jgi:hypothetical protein
LFTHRLTNTLLWALQHTGCVGGLALALAMCPGVQLDFVYATVLEPSFEALDVGGDTPAAAAAAPTQYDLEAALRRGPNVTLRRAAVHVTLAAWAKLGIRFTTRTQETAAAFGTTDASWLSTLGFRSVEVMDSASERTGAERLAGVLVVDLAPDSAPGQQRARANLLLAWASEHGANVSALAVKHEVPRGLKCRRPVQVRAFGAGFAGKRSRWRCRCV